MIKNGHLLKCQSIRKSQVQLSQNTAAHFTAAEWRGKGCLTNSHKYRRGNKKFNPAWWQCSTVWGRFHTFRQSRASLGVPRARSASLDSPKQQSAKQKIDEQISHCHMAFRENIGSLEWFTYVHFLCFPPKAWGTFCEDSILLQSWPFIGFSGCCFVGNSDFANDFGII